MEGFVNTNVVTPFEVGLKYSGRFSNYGVDKAYLKRDDIQQNHQQVTTSQYSQTEPDKLLGVQLPGNFDTSIITDSIPDNFDDGVNTVVTPNQTGHQRLKAAVFVGGSAVVIGALSLILSKGKISKTITDSLGKVVDGATKKIGELKQKQNISDAEGRYLAFLQGANKIAFMARGALFNITPLKDALFSKFVRKTCKLDKPCDAITDKFRKLSFSTVKSAYKKSDKDMRAMTDMFEAVNEKIAIGEGSSTYMPVRSVVDILKENLSRIKFSYSTNFSEKCLEQRNENLIECFKGLDKKTYDSIYGKMKTFVTDVDEWTTFVPERLVSRDKARIMSDLAEKKRVITNNPQDNFNEMSRIISKLENSINPENKDARELLKNLKRLSSDYISVSGEQEAISRQKLVEFLNMNLKKAADIVGNDKYSDADMKKITSLLRKFGKVINTDNKGLIEEQLSIYKNILPEEEYLKVKKVAQKAIDSFNKAIYTEGFEYTDKARDLAAGSALTDVAIGMALPIGTTAIAMSSADTKQKKRSVALKYGLPLLAGISTTTACTVKLISGGKALGLGAAVTVLGNELFERLDNFLIKRDNLKAQKEG